MVLSLKSVPGIGTKLFETLTNYYPDEPSALAAIRSMHSCEVGGISVNQALKFALNLFTLEHRVSSETVLRTSDAVQIYRDLQALAGKFLTTEYSLKKLELYFPLPPEQRDLIITRLDYSEQALKFVNQNLSHPRWDEFLGHLARLGPFRADATIPKVKSRAILTDDLHIEARLKDAGLHSLVGIDVIDPDKMKDYEKLHKTFLHYAKTEDVVFLALTQVSRYPDSPNFFELDLKGQVDLLEIVPELTLGKYAYNYERIAAACAAVEILQTFHGVPECFSAELPLKSLGFLKSALQAIDAQGNFKETVSKRLDILRKIGDGAGGIIAEAESALNAQLRDLIGASSLTLNGTQLLQILKTQQLSSFQEYLPDELGSAIQGILDKCKTNLLKALQVDPKDFPAIDDLIPREFSYPIEFSGEVVENLDSFVKKRARVEEFTLKRKAATKLEAAIPDVQRMLKLILELEFFVGLGRFFAAYDMQRPELLTTPGLVINHARNLFLQNDENEPAVPIDYNVGGIDCHGPRLNLLTGSNSGGKTTCELTLAQIVILGQMGFLVPAGASLHPFQEIYFFKKSSGQLSAGAFEATLLQFVTLASSDKLKLILADELEAITEPAAAARVIGSILLLLLENRNNYGVFITHIVELMLEAFGPELREKIRVDGIEATGLDDQLNLIVNRNPRLNFVAKSTPELILERLVRKSTGQEKEFFGKIRNRFRKGPGQ
jgi:DNA mismatch repair protein MutS2